MRNVHWLLKSLFVCSVICCVCLCLLMTTVNQQQLPLVVMTPSHRSRWKRNRYATAQQELNSQLEDESESTYEQSKMIDFILLCYPLNY